jgi:hypothetical protein
MRNVRRNDDRAGRGERLDRGFEGHLAAAAFDQQNLEQVAMAMRADQPVMQRRS